MTLAARGRILLRRLAASPAFTIVSILTLAIAIGANLVIFTVVNAILLRPLPFPEADDLVTLRHAAPGLVQMAELPTSPALYFLYASESRTLDQVAVFTTTQVSFTGPNSPERVTARESPRRSSRC